MIRRRIDRPTELLWGGWFAAARRVFATVWSNRITDWAAALTYYSVLSLFPGLLALTAGLALLDPAAIDSLVSTIRDLGPSNGTGLVIDSLGQLRAAHSYSGPLAAVGLASAVWTSSGYIGAFIRASNSLYGVDEGRPVWKTLPLRVGLTLAVGSAVAACAIGLLVTGGLANRVGRWLGVGDTAVQVWGIAKWPVLALLMSLICALLYWAAPNVHQRGFRWLTPGSFLAVLIWVIASAGFAVYASRFGSFNKVYGSLAGAVIFLVWLWLANLAVLLGAAFDAELARGARIEEGHPATENPVLPPRDEPGEAAETEPFRR
ncbi:YihY/virulence factor BrkB family protein [Nocardia sp. NPDC004722]